MCVYVSMWKLSVLELLLKVLYDTYDSFLLLFQDPRAIRFFDRRVSCIPAFYHVILLCLSSFCLDIHFYHLLLCFSSSCTLLFSLLLFFLVFLVLLIYFRTALCHSYSHACQKILNGPSCFIIGLLFFPPSEFMGVLLVYEVFLIFW